MAFHWKLSPVTEMLLLQPLFVLIEESHETPFLLLDLLEALLLELLTLVQELFRLPRLGGLPLFHGLRVGGLPFCRGRLLSAVF